MERLRQKDLDDLFSYLQGLYARRDLEEFKPSVVKSISGIVPSKVVSCTEVDPQRKDFPKAEAFILEPIPPDLPEMEKALETYAAGAFFDSAGIHALY